MDHHKECDGFRSEGPSIVPAGNGFVLDDTAGARMGGFFHTIGQAEAEARRHVIMVPCEGQCREW